MANTWFRLYNEFASDPKVQMMPEHMQRRLIMLFCMQSGNVTETLHETDRETAVAFYLRISDAELAETKKLFLSKNFINPDWTITHWSERQYDSDSSTARVRRHREAKKHNETLHETDVKRSCNGAEQNRTDTEQIQNRTDTEKTSSEAFASFWDAYPKKVAKPAAVKAWAKVKAKDVAAVMAGLDVAKRSRDWTKDGGQFIPNPATWLNGRRWEDVGFDPVSASSAAVAFESKREGNGTTTILTFSGGEQYIHHFNGTHYWKHDGMNCSRPDWILSRDGVTWSESSGWEVRA